MGVVFRRTRVSRRYTERDRGREREKDREKEKERENKTPRIQYEKKSSKIHFVRFKCLHDREIYYSFNILAYLSRLPQFNTIDR